MNKQSNPTASVAKSMHPNVATVGVATQHAAERGAAASQFPGKHPLHALANVASGPTGSAETAGEPIRPIQGPPTTTMRNGAGGPLSRWDNDIRAAKRRGNHQLAQRLQEVRANINLAFDVLEPVFVPAPSQRAMLALQAGAARYGVCTMKAVA